MFRPRIAAFAGALLFASLAAPLAAPGASAAPPPPGSEYVVKNGDYLFGIAMKLHVRFADLLAANDLTAASVIHPGDTLVVPTTRGVQPVQAKPAAKPASKNVDTVVAFALAQAGKPYRFAAAGPDAFDCSGLVTAAYKQIGVRLPQYSALQATYGSPVDWTKEPIVAGDLVFIADPDTGVIHHAGIAVSSTQWIQAVRAGDVVRVGRMPAASKIAAVRRIVTG